MSAPVPPFQAFLDSTREEVWRLLVARVGREAAEDCFQETYMSALRAYPELRHGEHLRSWVLTIARRKATDHRRRSARAALPVPEPEPEAPAGTEPWQAGLEDGEPELWRLVAELPPKQRAAVALRFTADLDHRQLGCLIGCSEEAARRNLSDGVRRLRAELRPGEAR